MRVSCVHLLKHTCAHHSKQQQYDISFNYETDGHFDHCGPAVTSTISQGINDPTITTPVVYNYELQEGHCFKHRKRYLAKFTPSFEDCADACRRATDCDIFTWHNATQVSRSQPCLPDRTSSSHFFLSPLPLTSHNHDFSS